MSDNRIFPLHSLKASGHTFHSPSHYSSIFPSNTSCSMTPHSFIWLTCCAISLFAFTFCAQVSWIRHRDIHILTVGSYTYTSDQRFQATHHQDTDDWTLQIKWAQKRDAGMYECQISTQPVRSYFVRLNVVGEYTSLSMWILSAPITSLGLNWEQRLWLWLWL